MIYAYACQVCARQFDVVKPADEYDRPEQCEACGGLAEREFVPQRVFFSGTKVEHAEYNPGLGCIVRNASHRKEIAKQKGLEEIGNEAPEKIHKKFDADREEKLEKAYDEVVRGWVGNGDIGA